MSVNYIEGELKLNKNLENAMYDIEKVDGLMYAIETSFLDIEVKDHEFKRAEAGINTFYALWDAVKKVRKDIDKLKDDEKVVDAIYAVNKFRNLEK